MASEPAPLAPEDVALLERLAARVVELRLEVPAILTLETAKPLAVLASQAMIFFEPIAQALFAVEGYRRFARLAENRAALEALATRIEARAQQARDERRAARRAPR